MIACGPLSGGVAAAGRRELPVETVRRHKLVFADLPDVPPDAPMTIDDDTGTHWRPFLRGAALLCTDPSTEPSPPTDRVPLDPDFAFAILDPDSPLAAARIVPFWREVWERGAPAWFLQAGQYTMSPDHRPLSARRRSPAVGEHRRQRARRHGERRREPHPRRRHDRPPARRRQPVPPRPRARRTRPRYALSRHVDDDRWRLGPAPRNPGRGGDPAHATAGERLDEDAFGPLVEFLVAGGLDGILALGTTGEGIMLAPDERRRAVELS